MEQRTEDGLSPYRVFSRAEWAALREDTPMTLAPEEVARYVEKTLGHHSAFQDLYALMSLSRLRFFSERTLDALASRFSPADGSQEGDLFKDFFEGDFIGQLTNRLYDDFFVGHGNCSLESLRPASYLFRKAPDQFRSSK